jgi:hypothetical protein
MQHHTYPPHLVARQLLNRQYVVATPNATELARRNVACGKIQVTVGSPRGRVERVTVPT